MPRGRQRVVAAGSWQALQAQYTQQAGAQVQHLPGKLLAPGFVDMHIHYPQTDVIGAPADGLLPWLETTPSPRVAFSRPRLCRRRGGILLDELLRNGVTTALAFATSHPTRWMPS
jgi:guanine deaminase